MTEATPSQPTPNNETAKSKCCAHHHKTHGGYTAGPIWLIGWLFTIGFVHLSFWQALLGLLIWPWYLGNHLFIR